jgi:hypothetical protein
MHASPNREGDVQHVHGSAGEPEGDVQFDIPSRACSRLLLMGKTPPLLPSSFVLTLIFVLILVFIGIRA